MGATVKIALVAEGASRVKGDLDTVGDSAKKAGKDIEKGFSEGIEGIDKGTSGISDKVKGAFAGMGLAAGAALAEGISGALQREDLTASLSANLGLSGKAAADAGRIAGQLYTENFSTDMAQAGEAVKRVVQDIGEGNDAWTKDMSAKVLTVSNTMEQDLGGTTRAVGQMLRTGLAKDAGEALDVFTRGIQLGADKAGDFADTLNEYGTQFRKFGIDGKEATGLLVQGLQAGARDADLVADAIKEFSLRGINGSKETADGFKSLGLNAKTMAADIAAGGERSNKALDVTLDRLRAIKDPVERSRIAVELFGTQAEDLGDALFALDPSTAVAGLGQVGGAAQKVVDTMGATNSAKIETFKRKLGEGFTNIVGQLAGFAVANSSWLLPLVATLGAVALAITAVNVATSAYLAVQAAVTTATATWKAAQLALNATFLANPVFLIIAGIVALVAVIVLAYKNSETFRNIVQGAWAAIQSAVSAVVNWFTTNIPKLWDAAVAVWNGIKAAGALAWAGIQALIAGVINVITAYFNAYKAVALAGWNAVQTVASAAWTAIRTTVSGVIGNITALFNTLRSAASAVWSAIQSAASAAWNAIRSAVSSVISSITASVNSLKSTVSNAFSNAASLLYNAGRQIVEGLANGIRAAAGRAVDAARGVVNDAVSGAKRLLGIASPSRVFRSIGVNTGKGLELGLLDSRRGIARAAASLMAIPSATVGGGTVSVDLAGAADQAAAAAAAAPRAVLELRSSGSRLDDLLLELIREAIRVRGGNAQQVLGTARA